MLPFGFFSINQDLYARGLGQVLRASRLYDQDAALAKDPAVYERLRLDPVVSFAIRLRKLLASGTDWYLEAASTRPEDRKLLTIMEALLQQVEQFTMARFNLAEAIIAGSRWAMIEGEERELEIPGLPRMKWWVPTKLRDVDKRRLRQNSISPPVKTREIQYRDSQGNTTDVEVPFQAKEWVWEIYRPVNQQWEEIDRDEYVRHVNDDREDTLGYGGGLASELYTYWYAKEVALQFGLQYLERWAMGMIVAHVNNLRDGQASAPASAQRMTDWLNTLKTTRTQHVLIADALDRLEVIDAPTGGWTACMQALEYLDGSMRVCILGASLPTTKDAKGGSYAMAEVQQGVSDLLARFDRTALDETLRRDLLGWCWRKNYATMCSLGLQKCNLPHLRIREDRREDHEVRANVMLKCRQAGMAIREDEAYSQTGWSPPAKDDLGNYLDPVLPTLGESESQRQAGQAKPAVSGKADAMKAAEKVNPVRPGEEPGEPGKPREAAADRLGGAF